MKTIWSIACDDCGKWVVKERKNSLIIVEDYYTETGQLIKNANVVHWFCEKCNPKNHYISKK